MSKILVGSARKDENGKYTGGKKGDQTGKEVSIQDFYVHKKGWIIIRSKDKAFAKKLADNMKAACNNENIGYSQSDRLAIIKSNIKTKEPTNCDCSSLVREVFIESFGVDPGNFTTSNEVKLLEKTGLVDIIDFVSLEETPVYNGDILVTKTKGHTVIVVSGAPYKDTKVTKVSYYPKYMGNSKNIDIILKAIGVPAKYIGAWYSRKKLAEYNGIMTYTGTYDQNAMLSKLAKNGKIKRLD